VQVSFQLVGEITEIELIAAGKSIRELKRLRKVYGRGRWRKLKGTAPIKFSDGTIHRGEFIGMRRTELAEKKSKSNGSSPRKKRASGLELRVMRKE
jgi:hypothetical protein